MKKFIAFIGLLFLIYNSFADESTYYPGYSLSNVQQNSGGFTGDLTMISPGPYGDDIPNLSLNVEYQTETRVRIKIYDPNNARWEVPDVIQNSTNPIPTKMEYKVEYTTNPFGIAVIRELNNEVLFNTTPPDTHDYNGLIFENLYIEINSKTAKNPNIYGLGERIYDFKLNTSNHTYVMFTKDNGNEEDVNLYGVQPFYIELREETHLFHGVFILNSNAMDVTLNPDHLTYRTIGGILDIYIFTGVSIDDVISQYTDLVGKPPMIPYFALGFHQCRWGYKDLDVCKTVVEQYKAHQLPLDTFWMDIDYMDEHKDFTFDPVNYPQEEVKEFVEQLHEDNQHYVIILDPGIKVEEGYAPYDDGISDGIFIISADTKLPYTAPVWPGECNFPDFTNPKTYSYWSKFIQQIFDEGIILDGLWVDMNELVTFDSSEELSESSESKKVERDSINLPYVPGGVNLNYRTVNLSAIHNTSIAFNLHSMYGFMEAKATASILTETKKTRIFVISRSTYAGHGHHAFHWLGDNYSTYKSMATSIQGILNMNMFGIPLVGADICGFSGNTTAELCARWIELGSFYPFSRDHNSIGMKSQELYALGDQVTNISRNVLLNRYSLIPYYYTLFYYSHEIGTPIWRALFYDFPEDPNTYSIDKQFLVGNALLVTPVLEEGATSVEGYFPNSDWYDYWSGEKILTKNSTLTFGKNLTLDAPLDKINVAIRGGYIIPKQEPALTTAESRNNSFELLAAIDSETGSASGKLFFDDGISLDTSQNSSSLIFELTYFSGFSYFETYILESNYDLLNHVLLDKMTFYGVDNITTLWVNNIKYPFEYDSTLKVLRIKGLNLSLNERFQIIWKTN